MGKMPLGELWDTVPYIHQEIQEESHPAMYWVIGTETSVPPLDPALTSEPALSHYLGVNGKHYLRQSPMNDRALVEI